MPDAGSTEERLDVTKRIYESYVSSGASKLHPEMIRDLAPRMPYLTHIIRTHFPADRHSSILDIGCGYGALLHAARQEGYRNCRGIDASVEQVKTAHDLGIADVSQVDMTSFLQEQPSDSFDVVIAFDVVEHLTKKEVCWLIDQVHRILKRNGRWIIHVPNAESPFFGRIRYGDFTHELAFTCGSLTALLKSSHFNNVQCFEDTPIVHGVKSLLRFVLWKALRMMMKCYLLAEKGEAEACIFTQNLLAVASPVK